MNARTRKGRLQIADTTGPSSVWLEVRTAEDAANYVRAGVTKEPLDKALVLTFGAGAEIMASPSLKTIRRAHELITPLARDNPLALQFLGPVFRASTAPIREAQASRRKDIQLAATVSAAVKARLEQLIKAYDLDEETPP